MRLRDLDRLLRDLDDLRDERDLDDFDLDDLRDLLSSPSRPDRVLSFEDDLSFFEDDLSFFEDDDLSFHFMHRLNSFLSVNSPTSTARTMRTAFRAVLAAPLENLTEMPLDPEDRLPDDDDLPPLPSSSTE